uniref:Elongation of very long chain fatty acids protein n=1 Tax=Ciona savignyi TaxID=51511 RepID=H2Z150_CIOSA
MRTNETAVFGMYPLFDFEHSLDDYDTRWITHGSFVPPILLSLLYMVLVIGGPKYMENRKRFDLRGAMTLWSLGLAIYSVMGSYRMLEIAYHTFMERGLRGVVCTGVVIDSFPSRFWTTTFLFSKFVEYGDTALIILRKQKLIFLHWYHHLTVALFVWYSARNNYGGSNLFITVNLTVHAFMYTYYFIRAARIRLPHFVNIFVTTLQISQMFVGCGMFMYLGYSGPKPDCSTSDTHLMTGGLMYSTYLFLFAKFFYLTYIRKEKPVQNGTELKKKN